MPVPDDVVETVAGAERVSLREYVEALLSEQTRALATAERERERAAIALREQEQAAAATAGDEREKAAAALRAELARSIAEGDERLREHVQQQVLQIQSALVSADKLELERIGRVAREGELVAEAAKEAITKADASVERRFAAANEFRQTLTDQAASFLPRKEYDARHATLTGQVQALADRLNRGEGREGEAAQHNENVQTWKIALMGMAITVFLTIVVIVVNLATANHTGSKHSALPCGPSDAQVTLRECPTRLAASSASVYPSFPGSAVARAVGSPGTSTSQT